MRRHEGESPVATRRRISTPRNIDEMNFYFFFFFESRIRTFSEKINLRKFSNNRLLLN